MATSNAVNIENAGVTTYDGAGNFTASAMLQYTVVLGDTGNRLTNVSGTGTSGQILTSSGGGVNPKWSTTSTNSDYTQVFLLGGM